MEAVSNQLCRLSDSCGRLEFAVGAVTIRDLTRLFALTKGDALFCFQRDFDGAELGPLVTSIAKRLVFGEAAPAPPVGSYVEFDNGGHF